MVQIRFPSLAACAAVLLAALGGCSTISLPGGFDLVNDNNATEGVRPSAPRPEPDARGVISYPNYQVAVAESGDTVAAVAGRLGLDPAALADKNGLPANARLRPGELVVLSSRVATSDSAIAPGGQVDVAVLAGSALDRAEGTGPAPQSGTPAPAPARPTGPEPQRHLVVRGETAYTIARQYGVSVRALGEWNGLDGAFTVREGQTLLIPVANAGTAPGGGGTTAPGTGSPTPLPPSATTPQPATNPPAVAAAGAAAAAAGGNTAPAAPQTAASDTAQLLQPVAGRIIRGYTPGRNEGLDFGASAGTPVRAAAAGTVAAITQDTDQVPIIVIRHPDNLLTVYANVDDIVVERGTEVRRGQTIAEVRAADSPFLHFEVRKGFDSVDPVPYLTD